MEVNIEELVAGLFFLAYVVYGPLVKGGFWKQNWTNKGGQWVTASEGPIFFVCMLILLTLEGLHIVCNLRQSRTMVNAYTNIKGPL